MTDDPPADADLGQGSYPVELSPTEIALVRTALRHLLASIGREEADEVEEIKALLARLPGERGGG
jgi:hypothetical protein